MIQVRGIRAGKSSRPYSDNVTILENMAFALRVDSQGHNANAREILVSECHNKSKIWLSVKESKFVLWT